MRILKQHLLDDFENLKKLTHLNLEIEWSGVPQRPRIFNHGSANLSPRLSIKELHLWIEGFDTGFREGFKAGFALTGIE